MDEPDRISYISEHATPVTNPQPSAAGKEAAPGESVDRIREIIFGGQMRDYDRRFSRLEQALVEKMDSLESDTRQRLDALESYLKQELDALSERLTKEGAERTSQDTSLAEDARKSNQELEKRLQNLDEQQSKLASNLRDLVLDQSKSLLAEIQQKSTASSAALAAQSDSIREAMTDRRALADLFTELSLRLKKEMDLPQPG